MSSNKYLNTLELQYKALGLTHPTQKAKTMSQIEYLEFMIEQNETFNYSLDAIPQEEGQYFYTVTYTFASSKYNAQFNPQISLTKNQIDTLITQTPTKTKLHKILVQTDKIAEKDAKKKIESRIKNKLLN